MTDVATMIEAGHPYLDSTKVELAREVREVSLSDDKQMRKQRGGETC